MRARVGLYYLVCVYHIHIHIHRDICTPCLSERPMDLWSHGEIKTLEVIPPQLPRSCAAGSRMFALRTLLSLQRRQGAKCEAGRWVPQTSIKLLLVLQHRSSRVIVWRSSTSKVAIFGLKQTNSGLCSSSSSKADGSVVVWGHPDYGGDSSKVNSRLMEGVVACHGWKIE